MKYRYMLWVLLVAVPAMALGAEGHEQASRNFQSRCSQLESGDFSDILDAPSLTTGATYVPATHGLGAYCRVTGYVTTHVGIKLGLPSTWNGKLVEVGCGGHCGELDDAYFAAGCYGPLRRGYACVVSDLGHKGSPSDAVWGYHDLQAKMDWGYQATHVVALAAKGITQRYYARPAHKSYFMGCSTGGRQGLQEAQRFPWDFDGIVAGAPPVKLSTVYMTFAWGIRATHRPSGSPLLGNEELKLLTNAALAQCDMDDGIRDNIIGNPLHCAFDPKVLMCKSDQTQHCLTPEQVEVVRKVYTGPMTSTGMKLSLGGPLPGSEYGEWGGNQNDWSAAYVGHGDQPASYEPLVTEGFRYLFFSPEPGPAWTLKDFDFDRDYKRFGTMESLYDSSQPDLRAFKAAGGKLIIYQGANDISVLPRSTIDYYETVERTMGGAEATRSFARLFILPGVQHCFGGSGAYAVDYLGYLEDWVEKGQAPDKMISSHVSVDDLKATARNEYYEIMRRLAFPLDPQKVTFSRPVYPYPSTVRYSGHGDPREASSFQPLSADPPRYAAQ